MAADLDVIFNLDEHAQEVQVDGRTLTAIVNSQGIKPDENPGINLSEVELHVRATDFDPLPRVGQKIKYNGQDEWVVVQVRPSAGLLTLVLQRFNA
jgi:hypothetical protein